MKYNMEPIFSCARCDSTFSCKQQLAHHLIEHKVCRIRDRQAPAPAEPGYLYIMPMDDNGEQVYGIGRTSDILRRAAACESYGLLLVFSIFVPNHVQAFRMLKLRLNGAPGIEQQHTVSNRYYVKDGKLLRDIMIKCANDMRG